MSRKPQHIYLDPVDSIWLTVASRIGFTVRRSPSVYASVREGVISVGEPGSLDPDDCLAQMVLHELCHSLIEGRRGLELTDWGLDNTTAKDEVREHACLRLQSSLADEYGLRDVLAPTTEHRGYYDGLPDDALEPAPCNEPAARTVELARQGRRRADELPWAPHLRQGLEATAEVLKVVRDFGAVDPAADRPPLWVRFRSRGPRE